MQITINTDTDDLPAVIRMLQAYAPPRKLRLTNEATGETVAEFTPSTVKITNDPIDITDDKLEAVIMGVKPEEIFTGEALKEALLVAGCAPGGADEAPTPEQVFAAPKSLFDAAPVPHAAERDLYHREPPTHSDVTVDAAGLPWDARIHSGAKTKLANGNWKLLRGVDPALVASVEAELRGDPKPEPLGTAGTGTTVNAPVPAPAPAVSPPPPPAPIAATPSAPPAPPAPPATPIVSAAPKPITNAAELVAAVMDKRFTTDQVNAACQAVGVENVASLLAKQDKLPEVLKELGV